MKLCVLLKNTRYMQYLSAIIATIAASSAAMYLPWTSPALPLLTSEDSPIGTSITIKEASWVVSSFYLGVIPGSILFARIVEKFGRKNCLLLSAIPLALPWFAIVFVKSVLAMCISRFIGGVGLALALLGGSVYIGEIAEKDIRGKLAIIVNVLRTIGTLFVLSVGPFVSYQGLALGCAAFPVVFVLLFLSMPESPYYLIKIGKRDAARNNLVRLSSSNTSQETIENRLKEIETSVENDMKHRSTVWEFFSKEKYRKSLIVMAGIKFIQMCSGTHVIHGYMQSIIQSSESGITPENSSLIAGVIQLFAGCDLKGGAKVKGRLKFECNSHQCKAVSSQNSTLINLLLYLLFL